MRIRLLVAMVGVMPLVGCGTMHVVSGIGTAPDVIMAPEIVAAKVVDAYQAVTRLRPEFLTRRAPVSAMADAPTGPRVFLDDVEVGGIDALRTVPLEAITYIRYLSPTEATLRFGAPQPNGAIVVSTSRSLR